MPSSSRGRWVRREGSMKGENRVNRIVSIHPSGSSWDLDAPTSSLHCLACRITPGPLLSRALKNVRSPFLQHPVYFLFLLSFSYIAIFSLSLSLSIFPLKKGTRKVIFSVQKRYTRPLTSLVLFFKFATCRRSETRETEFRI